MQTNALTVIGGASGPTAIYVGMSSRLVILGIISAAAVIALGVLLFVKRK